MKGTINFYHPDEDLEYHIRKCFCKVVFLNQQNTLVLEIESDDDLEHVVEDSLQNEFPQVSLNLEDFIIQEKTERELIGKLYNIPASEEKMNADEEMEEVYYTNLNVNDELNLETNSNEVKFGTDDKGNMRLLWNGECSNFIDEDNSIMKFRVRCTFLQEDNDDSEE